PAYKAGTLVDLVDTLPSSELPRKLTLLERAAAQARSAKQSSNKLFQMGEVAERWLELGEKEKALALFADGRRLVDALPPAKRTDAGSFLARAGGPESFTRADQGCRHRLLEPAHAGEHRDPLGAGPSGSGGRGPEPTPRARLASGSQ